MALKKCTHHNPFSWHCHPHRELCPYSKGIWGILGANTKPWALCFSRGVNWPLLRFARRAGPCGAMLRRCTRGGLSLSRSSVIAQRVPEVSRSSPRAPRMTDSFVTGLWENVSGHCRAEKQWWAEGVSFEVAPTDRASTWPGQTRRRLAGFGKPQSEATCSC